MATWWTQEAITQGAGELEKIGNFRKRVTKRAGPHEATSRICGAGVNNSSHASICLKGGDWV